jgi:hypothetical protein
MTIAGAPDDNVENWLYPTTPTFAPEGLPSNAYDHHYPFFDPQPTPAGHIFRFDLVLDYHFSQSASSDSSHPASPDAPLYCPIFIPTGDTVVCQWGGCGTVISRIGTSIKEHVEAEHPDQLMIAMSSVRTACRWANCRAAPTNVLTHLDFHYGAEIRCSVCCEVFACPYAREEHSQTKDSCRTCQTCGFRSETADMNAEHTLKCPMVVSFA